MKQKMNSYERLVLLTSCAKMHKFIANVTDKEKPCIKFSSIVHEFL